MDYRIEEIASILIQQIARYEPELEVETESKGIVTYVGDGIARVQMCIRDRYWAGRFLSLAF